MIDCIYKIRDVKRTNGKGDDMMMKSHAYALFAHLLRNYSRIVDSEEMERQSEKLKRLDSVFSYIELNYGDNITTASLAKRYYVTEAYFCRFFKKATGTTVASYLSEFRVKKASLLLENTDCNISTVAETVGIDDPNYFSRIFKKVTGMPPSEYREKHKKQ